MSQVKVRLFEEGALPINNKLAGIVPMALPAEQLALENDIAKNSQRDPILLWKGQVVDGRCRQKALVSLQRHILYKELDASLSEEDVTCLVKSMNTRRNLTISQKITIAAKEYCKSNQFTVKQLAEQWGASVSIIENAVWLQRTHPQVIESLFNGRSVAIKNTKGIAITSNKVSAIYAFYKREIQDAIEYEEKGWSDFASIETQAGKDWYLAFLRRITDKNLSLEVTGALIELANFKFKLASDNLVKFEEN
jgi:hypothetical protein